MNDKEQMDKLHFLIQCLEEEMPEYAEYALPDDPKQAFDLYRALCNVRMPSGDTGHTLPDDFYAVQSEVLKSITGEKGVTEAAVLPPAELDQRLSLWQGDITTLRADAIVNAANSQMLGCFSPLHGCIDNMIHTMAGAELREKCCQIMRAQGHEEPTGRAKITPGYNLPARFVIHTVGPIVSGRVTGKDKELLASCYRSVLSIASDHQLESVAFCCISTGVFHFPQDKAAEIAVSTVRSWLDAHPETTVRRVIFNVFKDSDRDIYRKILLG
ncbi:MAG: protein-ADP-ribose hydrolase [Lachnospiraceae bacterium]|jgi:O-acetyl-ADP-ribose deacetylase (regulator of RNase III)|nr:protein-ADP-ribose hydrolase [Lachnospiraceae bacterium]MCI1657151.1 protein-ADP-ribose hydrolase [Lachnospiraceae bacterium]MCI2195632.1 protein-ADP-ribose hydrolase [Lachnospiraceae bacterium]